MDIEGLDEGSREALDEARELPNNNEESDSKSATQDRCSVVSLFCRICYDDTLDEPIIAPCYCKGTVGLMHKSCLERWLAESNTNACDLCHKQFDTERTIKHQFGRSLLVWLRTPPSSFSFAIRDVRVDLVICSVLVPAAVLLTYVCLFSAEYYNQQKLFVLGAARWTSISVLFMGLVMLLGFFLWMFLLIRYHTRVWYFWWQRETVVRVSLPPDVLP